MKKLFLASFATYTLDLVNELLTKPAAQLKAALIPTAGDPYTDKTFVNMDRDKLVEMGFSVTDIDLKEHDKSSLEAVLKGIDLVLVAGGNTFYLLDQSRKSGFDTIILSMLDRGVVYVGSSAGSALCCPTIEGARLFDDPNQAPDLSDYTGLNLYDKIILPHAQKEKYAQRIHQTQQDMESRGYESILLTDDEAIIVMGDQVRKVTVQK